MSACALCLRMYDACAMCRFELMHLVPQGSQVCPITMADFDQRKMETMANLQDFIDKSPKGTRTCRETHVQHHHHHHHYRHHHHHTTSTAVTIQFKNCLGSLDAPIAELVHRINGSRDYYTTSSCSGMHVLQHTQRSHAHCWRQRYHTCDTRHATPLRIHCVQTSMF
jgi:hypothetical protein